MSGKIARLKMEFCDLAHGERLAIFPQCRRQLLALNGRDGWPHSSPVLEV